MAVSAFLGCFAAGSSKKVAHPCSVHALKNFKRDFYGMELCPRVVLVGYKHETTHRENADPLLPPQNPTISFSVEEIQLNLAERGNAQS